MVNTSLFTTQRLPATDALNSEFAPAYAFTPAHALAQYAATGTFHSTFYADEQAQLAAVLGFAAEVDDKFLARTAIWMREHGFMKDTPAVLLALLSKRNPRLFRHVFARVVDDAKMLKNFVAVMRSGAVGRKSLGTAAKRAVQAWLEARSDEQIFRASIGNDPSLADVVRMVHPKPATESRKALYAWLIGREYDAAALPECVRAFEAWKRDDKEPLPDVPFEMLTSVTLGVDDWQAIARKATWQQTRIHLGTFTRQGVFGDEAAPTGLRERITHAWSKLFSSEVEKNTTRELVELVAARLRDREAIVRARAFPYQLLAAHRNADAKLPAVIRESLADALEIATENVPVFAGKVWICTDVSGSMSSPVTGYRKGSTTKVRCIDVAALISACVLRKNPEASLLPFHDQVVRVKLDAQDSVLDNADKLSKLGGGGTNCSAPLRVLNERKEQGDLVLFVSDNESWMDARNARGTEMLEQWTIFKRRNKNARLVCLDLQPNRTTQASDAEDILNVGGFSDHVFTLIAEFAAGRFGTNLWVNAIEAVEL